MVYKIALDAGHGLSTAGKKFLAALDPKETHEWQRNSIEAEAVEKKLLSRYNNVEVLRVDDRTGKKDISRPERCRKANEWKADIYISFHHNAVKPESYTMVNGIKCFSGGGIVVYVCKGLEKNGTTRTYQRDLYQRLIQHTGLKGNRANPYGQADFDVLVLTDMPALLIENGFMDSYYDVPIVLSDEFVEQTSEAIVEFLANAFNLKLKEPTLESPKSEEPPKDEETTPVPEDKPTEPNVPETSEKQTPTILSILRYLLKLIIEWAKG